MQNKKISLWEKISFGSGDIASCVTFGVTSSYLSYYYTDIAGISLAAVGIILGISRVLEAAANFYTGIAIDQTTSKHGKTKPFLYTTTIPLVIMFLLLFVIPDISLTGKTIFAFITCLGFCILYAVNNTAYCTMQSLLTDNIIERKKLGNYKNLGGGIGSLIASFCTLPLIAMFGNESRYQFAIPAFLYAVISLIILLNCAYSCKERVGIGQEKMKFSESLRCALKSHSWIILCIISCLAFLANTLRGQSCIYYAKYCLGMESWTSILLTMSTIAQISAAPFTAKILTKLGSKNCLYVGFSLYIVFSLLMFLAGDHFLLLVIFTFLSGIGCTLAVGTSFTICTDTMDEVEYLTGKRPQGIMTSIMMCTMKLGIAGAGIVFSFVLNAGGYVADTIQTPASINAIHWNMFWLPIIIYGAGLILIGFFRLDKKHAEIIKALHERRA